MDKKALFVVFLSLFGISIVCNVAITALQTTTLCSQSEPMDVSYLTLDGGDGGDGDEPESIGDPTGGWP